MNKNIIIIIMSLIGILGASYSFVNTAVEFLVILGWYNLAILALLPVCIFIFITIIVII